MTNCIPNRRRKLPFVYNVGAIAYEHEFWVGTVFGAVEVAGTKWCGKTWTALAHAQSVSYVDEELLAETGERIDRGARQNVQTPQTRPS